jgi:hypothetical protein
MQIVLDKKASTMPSQQGDLALLKAPVAQELLKSTISAHLACVSRDGTPRVVPIWFHWTGEAFVLGTPLTAPKVKTLQSNPKVALTIDSDVFPYKVLRVRGTAKIETVDGVVPEYDFATTSSFNHSNSHRPRWLYHIGCILATWKHDELPMCSNVALLRIIVDQGEHFWIMRLRVHMTKVDDIFSDTYESMPRP